MTILQVAGIDPSLSNFGLVRGSVDTSTAPFTFQLEQIHLETTQAKKAGDKTPKNMDDIRRARQHYIALQAILSGVDVVFAEVPIGSRSARAMASYGVCVGLMASIDAHLIRVSPTDVKLAATGNKEASKQDMIQWAVSQYPHAQWLTKKQHGIVSLTNANEHMADALAAVFAGLRSDAYALYLNQLAKVSHESLNQNSDYTDWLRRLPGHS